MIVLLNLNYFTNASCKNNHFRYFHPLFSLTISSASPRMVIPIHLLVKGELHFKPKVNMFCVLSQNFNFFKLIQAF